ncbi:MULTISPECIES: flavin reductase [Pseudomonas]|jgi:3-hydroxy-9,10-secoandrosta-1,3,5(10)-triene-9,17-dione monooxygenase reductase component|uniref:Flavin reductase n=1 Tax=Pseudomonas sp. Hg7Tf TaxID=3236988 RepID=A0AB39HRY4_9PSED|nr:MULTISPECIES: flavin reductase [Pseudomonas]MDD1975063.1 flavin reductase [Pseudomonas putida]QYX49832.1 flavin reductase [Pseudomonas sp. S11A 273]
MNTSHIDPKQFRQALGAFTTGVTIVTTRGEDGQDYGLTANSFNSVSLEPPMVLWSLSKTSSSASAFIDAEHFAVHILSADQESLSNRFAKRGEDKFATLSLQRGPGEIPLLEGCSARFQCRTTYRYEGGDHIIFVGEVVAFDSFDKSPLVFHSGGYSLLLKKNSVLEGDSSSFEDDWLGFLLGRTYYQLLMPIRERLKEQGLRDIDYELLTVLSMGDGRTLADLQHLVAISGQGVSAKDLQPLIDRSLIVCDQDRRVHFTEQGRRFAIELLAFAKAAETSAEQALNFEEAQLLKVLLKRVIRSTGSGLPAYWRKENFWRENNIWTQASCKDGTHG